MLLNWLHKLSYLDFNRAIKQFYTVKTICLCQIQHYQLHNFLVKVAYITFNYLNFHRVNKQFYTVKTTCLCQI